MLTIASTIIKTTIDNESIIITVLSALGIIDASSNSFEYIGIRIIYVVFSIAIFFIFVTYTYKMYVNWDGGISKRQFRINKYELADTNMVQDTIQYLFYLLNKSSDIILYNPWINPSDEIIYEEYSTHIPWHIDIAEMLRIKSPQYKINIDEDWHSNMKCYISCYSNDKYKVAIYCCSKQPTQVEIFEFLKYINSFDYDYQEIIVAIKNVDRGSINKEMDIGNRKVTYIYKNNVLDELIDFSEYYADIIKGHKSDISQGNDVTIEDVYVEPLCTIGRHKGKSTPLYKSVNEWLVNDSTKKHIALLGDFGQGKSTFCNKLAYDMISHEYENRIPILIQLKGKSPRSANIFEILSYFANKYGINPHAMNKLNINGRLLLIFDGFDEMDLVGNDNIRIAHFQSIWKLACENAKIIITGRPNYFFDINELTKALGSHTTSKEIPHCELFHLQLFNDNQVLQALRNSDPIIKKELYEIVNKNPSSSFADLLRRPSHLFFVSQIWMERDLSTKTNNLNSSFIINEFIEHCYQKQQVKNYGSNYLYLTPIEREFFMIGIAIKMYKNNTTVLLKELFIETLNELIEVYPDNISSTNSSFENIRSGKGLREFIAQDNNAYEAILSDIRVCGLIVYDYANEGFTYAHKSFYDFLVAKYFLCTVIHVYDNNSSIYKSIRRLYGNLKIGKNDLTIRKMIAELIAPDIKASKSKNMQSKCLYAFSQCYKLINKRRLKIKPIKVIKNYFKYKDAIRPNILHMGFRDGFQIRTASMLTIFMLAFLMLIIRIASIQFNFTTSLLSESNNINIELNKDVMLLRISYVLYILLIVLVIVNAIRKRIYSGDSIVKLEITFLTWFYICKKIGIPDSIIMGNTPRNRESEFRNLIYNLDAEMLTAHRKKKKTNKLN